MLLFCICINGPDPAPHQGQAQRKETMRQLCQSSCRYTDVPFILRSITVRISIGQRLFCSVLLAIVGVVATAIVLMRQNVTRSVGEYALNIELDRLDELSRALSQRYASAGWAFLPADSTMRRDWIVREMRRLDQARNGTGGALPAPPPPPAAPLPPAPPAPIGASAASVGMDVLPLPPLPPIPGAPGGPGIAPRVTLLDATGAYLAGQPVETGPSARRALMNGATRAGYLVVTQPPQPGDALAGVFLDQLRSSLWTIGAASIVLSAIAAMLLAANFRQPIERLASGARALAAGRFDVRLAQDRGDELGDLAASFNALAARLDAAEDARRQWVADTSHELRTPLSVLRAQLEAVQDGVRAADPATVAAMLRQVLSLNTLIDDLYALARLDVGVHDYAFAPVDMLALAREQALAFVDKFAAGGVRLEVGALPAGAMVAADAQALRQVLANLLENSNRYTAAGGVVRLAGSVDAHAVTLTLDDSAPGVAPADLARLGQRFFRADASRSRALGGAGLGLALAQRIVAQHGGTLRFAPSPLGGLRVAVSLPQAPA
jgi:two-component system sensor histidine kinase BaeS